MLTKYTGTECFACVIFQQLIDKEGQLYFASLEINNVTVEDAGKYKVTAKNELGESNATISLNFDSKYLFYINFYRCDVLKWKKQISALVANKNKNVQPKLTLNTVINVILS